MSCHYHSFFTLGLYINQSALTRNLFHWNMLIWTYYTAFKNATKDTFCKSSTINTDIGFRNSVILKFKWRKIFEFLSCFKCIVILDEYVNEMSRLQNCFPLTLRRFFLKMAFSNSNLHIFFITLDLSSFLHQKLLFSSLLPHFFFPSISFFLLYYWSSVARTKQNNTDASCL